MPHQNLSTKNPLKKPTLTLGLLLISIACFAYTPSYDDTPSDKTPSTDNDSNQYLFTQETNDETTNDELTDLSLNNTSAAIYAEVYNENDLTTETTPNTQTQASETEKNQDTEHTPATEPPSYNGTNDNNELDFSLIQTSPHELALTQVLSEVCPTLLDDDHQQQFAHSYQSNLKLLMPELDPDIVMPNLNQNPEYLKILDGMREWTTNYDKDENRALCVEFSEATFDEQQ